jgi:ABC-type amino acid transport substrate-binding protein
MYLRRALAGFALTLLQLSAPAQAQTYLAGGTEWRPFSYADAMGNLSGISVDIARRVMQLADIDAQFVSYPVNRLQAMLGKGELDLNYADSAQWNSAQELSRFVWSAPYMNVQEHLYFLSDSPAISTPADQLRNLTVGIVRGYTYLALNPAFADKRLNKLETSQDMALLNLLQAKRVDAVAMVDDLFNFLVAEHRLDPGLFRKGAQLSDAPIVMKLQPKYAALLPSIDAAIGTLIRNGEVERIRKSYLPAEPFLGCQAEGAVC